MSIGKKSPGSYSGRKPKTHTPYVRRWAKRKEAEKAQAQSRAIDDIALAGSRRNLWWQRCHLERVKADKRKAEKKLLESVSLGDLIK